MSKAKDETLLMLGDISSDEYDKSSLSYLYCDKWDKFKRKTSDVKDKKSVKRAFVTSHGCDDAELFFGKDTRHVTRIYQYLTDTFPDLKQVVLSGCYIGFDFDGDEFENEELKEKYLKVLKPGVLLILKCGDESSLSSIDDASTIREVSLSPESYHEAFLDSIFSGKERIYLTVEQVKDGKKINIFRTDPPKIGPDFNKKSLFEYYQKELLRFKAFLKDKAGIIDNQPINYQINFEDYLGKRLLLAIKRGDTDNALEIIKIIKNPNFSIGGYTPLESACRYGEIEVIEALLEREDINVNLPNSEGKSPIMSAYKGKNEERHQDVIDILMRVTGINSDDVYKIYGDESLKKAYEANNITLFRDLLHPKYHLDVNEECFEKVLSKGGGLTPPVIMRKSIIKQAESDDRSDFVNALLSHPDISDGDVFNVFKEFCLWGAYELNNPNLFARLLQNYGAFIDVNFRSDLDFKVNGVSEYGESILSHAKKVGNGKFVDLLLQSPDIDHKEVIKLYGLNEAKEIATKHNNHNLLSAIKQEEKNMEIKKSKKDKIVHKSVKSQESDSIIGKKHKLYEVDEEALIIPPEPKKTKIASEEKDDTTPSPLSSCSGYVVEQVYSGNSEEQEESIIWID